MNDNKVYIAFWSLKFDPEEPTAKKEIGQAKAKIQRWCHPALYAKRMIGFVVVTDETAQELAKRLGAETQDLQSLDNVHVILAPQPDDIACAMAGTFGPLNHWVRTAWVEARKRNGPQNVRHSQRWQRFS